MLKTIEIFHNFVCVVFRDTEKKIYGFKRDFFRFLK